MTSLAPIREQRGVPARRGMRVTVDNRPGRITSARGGYVMVRFDGWHHSRPCHPTWRVTYFNRDGSIALRTGD